MPVAEQRQCMAALEVANRNRLARAELKRQMKAGEMVLGDVLAHGVEIPEEIKTMPIFDLLKAQPLWGVASTRRFLAGLAIGESLPLAAFGDRTRALILREADGVIAAERNRSRLGA